MKPNPLAIFTAATIALSSTSPLAHAASMFFNYSPILGGSTSDHQWTSPTRPAGVSSSVAGTAGQWVAGLDSGATNHGILSDDGSSAYRFFVPHSFNGTSYSATFGSDTVDFLSSGGIYNFMSQTHLEVSSDAPLVNVQSIVFQISMATGVSSPSGSGSPVDLVDGPTLHLFTTNGNFDLAADFSLTESSGIATVPGFGPTNVDLLGYQWDLSSITGTITSYNIDWQSGYHSVFLGADTTESSTVNSSIALVPEPSTWALLGLGAGLVLFKLRRRTILQA